MDSTTWPKDTFKPPVANIFENGHWRVVAFIRLTLYILPRFTGLFYIYHAVRLVGASLRWIQRKLWHLLTQRKPKRRLTGRLRLREVILLALYFLVKWWSNDFTIRVWWYMCAILLDAESFNNAFSNAWGDKLTRYALSIHVFVDGKHFLALIPTKHEALVDDDDPFAEDDDAQTLEHLRMCYCAHRLRRGLGELILPKKLVRIDKVQASSPSQSSFLHLKSANNEKKVKFSRNRWYTGDRGGTLELGRTATSRVTFFEDPWGVKGQLNITKELLENDRQEQGLEFIRLWNTTAISSIVLLPFGLSFAFAATWVGIYIANGTDVQVAVTTAFTVSSYIVTSGALFVALIAFIDNQSSKEM